MRMIGTTVRGIRTPIIKNGDDLEQIVIDSLLLAAKQENFEFNNRDVLCITEAIVGISNENYASVDDIAKDIKRKLKSETIGIVNPILSRNRFSLILKGIARSAKKVIVQLSFPSDEVGNGILDANKLANSKFDLNSLITEKEYLKHFGNFTHPFTGINMVKFYKKLIEKEGAKAEFILSNNPKDILKYTRNVIACDIHTRENTKKVLRENGANVIGLDDILTRSINSSGYNKLYGLLGSNKSTEEVLKLFPKNADQLVRNIQKKLKKITGKTIEVMVYGDGAFKDPVGGIWELADPVVAAAYTPGLKGTPNEIKLKYISDNKYPDLEGEELLNAIKKEIKTKDKQLKGKMASQGTTPRRYIDLIGSLADLTSGSGDKGTPVVYIQGYFDNFSNE